MRAERATLFVETEAMRRSTQFTLAALSFVGMLITPVFVLTRSGAKPERETVEVAQLDPAEPDRPPRVELTEVPTVSAVASPSVALDSGSEVPAANSTIAEPGEPSVRAPQSDAAGKAAAFKDVWLEELRLLEEEISWFRGATGKAKTASSGLVLGRSIAMIRDSTSGWVEDNDLKNPTRTVPEWDESAQRFTIELGSRRYTFEDKEFPEVREVLAAWPNPMTDELIDKVQARADEALRILKALTANLPK